MSGDIKETGQPTGEFSGLIAQAAGMFQNLIDNRINRGIRASAVATATAIE